MFVNCLIKRFGSKRLKKIEVFKRYPFEVQKETLMKLLKSAQNTEWGRKYKFGSIETVEQYQKRVPIHTYEDFKPFIEKLMKGEKDIIWPGRVKWFAKSSGTTSDKSKFIPLTNESLNNNHFRGGRDVLQFFIKNHPDNRIFSGKGLTIGGSHQVNNYKNRSYSGDLSAIMLENQPFWVRLVRTPPKKIALMSDWEEKIEKVYQTTINQNITNFSGVPSWNMVFMKYVLEKTGKSNLLEVWPNLELFIHGGVSFKPYEDQFKKLIPSEKMKYIETYNASEGFFAIQDELDTDDMLLMMDYGIFYEFIPMDEIGSETPTVLTIGEVQKNVNYAIVISSNSGLWRYLLGDTVYFTSLYPHKIQVSGRTKHFINAFGEELIIENAENALRNACEKTGAQIAEYTAAPVYMSKTEKGKHQWLIEFEILPGSMEDFTKELDNALKSLNSDYEAKRYKDITLAPPIVQSVKPGLFYNWLKKKGKLGGQNKVPRLSNSRVYVDELLEMNDKL